MSDRSRARLPGVDAVVGVGALVAYVSGITQEWVLDPIGGWFGGLTRNQKVVVVAMVVMSTLATLTMRRHRRQRVVRAADVAIAQSLDATRRAPTANGTDRPDGDVDTSPPVDSAGAVP